MYDQFYKLGEDGRTPVLCESEAEAEYWNGLDPFSQIVAQETVGYSRVMTSFDGMASSADEGPPMLFSTVVTNCPDRKSFETATWEEAEREHVRICAWLREEIAQGRLPERVITRTYFKPRSAHAQADPHSGAASQHATPDSADPEA